MKTKKHMLFAAALPIIAFIAYISSFTLPTIASDTSIDEWTNIELNIASDMGLFSIIASDDLSKPVTRAEFATVSVMIYEALSGAEAEAAADNPFADTNDIEVLKAFNIGITLGVSPTMFEPDKYINREEAATMLARVYKKASMQGWSPADDADFGLSYDRTAPLFADDDQISGWAKDSVYFIASNKIIVGYDENLFIPKHTASDDDKFGYINISYEQALLAAVRIYKYYNNMSIAIITDAHPDEQIYTVKSGDTLARIAEMFYGYGNNDLYTLIKDRNGLASDNIKIGQKLIIPAIPAP